MALVKLCLTNLFGIKITSGTSHSLFLWRRERDSEPLHKAFGFGDRIRATLSLTMQKGTHLAFLLHWRRERDSNPRVR